MTWQNSVSILQFQAKIPWEQTCNLGAFLSQKPFSWDDCNTVFLWTPERNFAKKKKLLLQEFQNIFSFNEFIARVFCHKTYKALLEMFVLVHSTKTHQNLSHSWDQNEPQATTTPINTCDFNHVWKVHKSVSVQGKKWQPIVWMQRLCKQMQQSEKHAVIALLHFHNQKHVKFVTRHQNATISQTFPTTDRPVCVQKVMHKEL